VYRSEDTLVQALKAGDIDFAEGVTPLQIKALQGDPTITAQAGDSPGFDEIAFNVGSVNLKTGEPMGDPNPAVLDKNFRFALTFAIDREQIAEKVYQGAAEPAGNIIPPAYETYQWEAPPDAYAYDPEKTRQLLDEAGYTVGDDGWRTMPDGSPIGKLRLFARSDSETSQGTMAFFKEWLADVQIDSEVTAMESSKLTNVILDGEYDTFEWGWFVEPDPDSMLSYFTCDQRGSWSDSWYCDPEYDRLYEQQNAELDEDQRAEIVKQMQAMLYEDAPYLNTAYNQIGEAYRSDRWEGFVPQPNPGGILLFQYGHANYLNLAPAEASQSGGADDGADGGQALLYGGGAAVLVGGLVGGLLLYRRAHADQRE
jgi:peptide/nickel transport system substrate-binding protein